MGYYINCIKHFDELTKDIKDLIPEMNVRRRMSRVVRMGVSTAIESLQEFDEYGEIDGIITATGLGCIADSEKFLSNIITAQEQMLNPTPFIQSTFNTVGAQIALLRKFHGYNNTFSHRYTSAESAIIDAMIRIDSGLGNNILVGVFDEATPILEKIMTRLGLLKNKCLGEGAVFFVLSSRPTPGSVAQIEEIAVDGRVVPEADRVSGSQDTIWSGAIFRVLTDKIRSKTDGYIINDMAGRNNSLIKLKCL